MGLLQKPVSYSERALHQERVTKVFEHFCATYFEIIFSLGHSLHSFFIVFTVVILMFNITATIVSNAAT